MNTRFTPFGIKFAPEHFPVGTTFTVSSLTKYEDIAFEAVRIIKNGYSSYVIETDMWDNNLGIAVSINIDYVNKIIKRGTGPLVIVNSFTFDFKNLEKSLIDDQKKNLFNKKTSLPSFKTHRFFDYRHLSDKNSGFLNKYHIDHTALFDIDSFVTQLFKQSFVKLHLLGRDTNDPFAKLIGSAPKKRLNRWIKQNINRFLKDVSKANEKHDEKIAKSPNDHFDDFESDARHFSYLDHYSTYDLTEQGKQSCLK